MAKLKITRGSGNVFADIGLKGADEMLTERISPIGFMALSKNAA